MNPSRLAVRIRKELHNHNSPAFTLDVSLEIPAGISILFGPSGAGKSTLLDCIAGLLCPDTGRVAIADEVVFDTECGTDLPAQKRHIAYVFQSLALFPHMSVAQNVTYGLQHTPKVHADQLVKDILGAFRVEKLAGRRPAEISGGEKQRVALARSLVTQPRALLLDEPLTGLDAELKTSIMDDLRIWNSTQKIPILYVTHTREEVDALGERVIAIDHGRLVSTGTPREVLDAPRKKRLAQAAGFENLLSGVVVDLRESDGVMRVRLTDSTREIEVPLGYSVPGDTVRIAVRAGDILLASQPPVGLSARNILEARIVSLEQRAALVIVKVDCGAVFTVHVTSGAVRALELAVDRPVWLVLKTHSCHLVD